MPPKQSDAMKEKASKRTIPESAVKLTQQITPLQSKTPKFSLLQSDDSRPTSNSHADTKEDFPVVEVIII